MRYRVITGINYPDGKGGENRAEPGDIVDDLPEQSAKWLLRDGHIEKATERKPSNKAKATKEIKAAVEEAEQPAEIPDKLADVRGEAE